MRSTHTINHVRLPLSRQHQIPRHLQTSPYEMLFVKTEIPVIYRCLRIALMTSKTASKNEEFEVKIC